MHESSSDLLPPDPWADQDTAGRVLAYIRTLLDDQWPQHGLPKIRDLRVRHRDKPLILAVTEASLDPDIHRVAERLTKLSRDLADTTWQRRLAKRLPAFGSLGVLSLGTATIQILEIAVGEERPSKLVSTHPAILRGLGYLPIPIVDAPAQNADGVLVPAVALFGSRLWTTPRIADVAVRALANGKAVLPVAHPLRRLSPLNRSEFRPPGFLIDIRV